MTKESSRPGGPKDRKKGLDNKSRPDATTQREGGDDSLADSSPSDSRSDEKVIVNEQRENKIVNAPSQTAANTSEGDSNDEEIINE
jgi:hypothetical protein